jgi:NADPH-dependent stearoyl-CoA 9-desaturase
MRNNTAAAVIAEAEPSNAPISLDAARRAAFAREIDALHKKYAAKVGAEDLEAIRAMDKLSRRMMLLGRALIHVSPEPVTFLAGVTALWIGKQLNLTDIAHPVMHGAYDQFDDPWFHSERFRVDAPIEEPGWRHAHNVLHHSYTNIIGKDPDARFGLSRLNESLEHEPHHRLQLLEVAFNWLNMAMNLNAQVVGLVDVYFRDAGDEDVLDNRTWKTVAQSHWRYVRRAAPYVMKNFVLWPALAGPFFPKVLLGNLMAEAARNVFTAVAIYCGHVGDALADFPRGKRAQNKADWYLMQIAATSDFQTHHLLSVLIGALDHQIEHHLFPKLPHSRLRELAPELRAICERYGVPYRTGPWSEVIRGMVGRIASLSVKPTG